MGKISFAVLAALAISMFTANAQQDIKLPAPNQNRNTLSVAQALATRHSVREFSKKQLSMQDLSDLCWAACGQSRDAEHITSPTAMNKQEIRLFVFDESNVCEYIPKENVLRIMAYGDHRRLVAGGRFTQDFVKDAPVSLVMVIDFEKFGSQDVHAVRLGCVDAGIVSENVNLFCQSAGFVTVPRASMDVDGICNLLGFTYKQLPIMNNPVGYPKE